MSNEGPRQGNQEQPRRPTKKKLRDKAIAEELKRRAEAAQQQPGRSDGESPRPAEAPPLAEGKKEEAPRPAEKKPLTERQLQVIKEDLAALPRSERGEKLVKKAENMIIDAPSDEVAEAIFRHFQKKGVVDEDRYEELLEERDRRTPGEPSRRFISPAEGRAEEELLFEEWQEGWRIQAPNLVLREYLRKVRAESATLQGILSKPTVELEEVIKFIFDFDVRRPEILALVRESKSPEEMRSALESFKENLEKQEDGFIDVLEQTEPKVALFEKIARDELPLPDEEIRELAADIEKMELRLLFAEVMASPGEGPVAEWYRSTLELQRRRRPATEEYVRRGAQRYQRRKRRARKERPEERRIRRIGGLEVAPEFGSPDIAEMAAEDERAYKELEDLKKKKEQGIKEFWQGYTNIFIKGPEGREEIMKLEELEKALPQVAFEDLRAAVEIGGIDVILRILRENEKLMGHESPLPSRLLNNLIRFHDAMRSLQNRRISAGEAGAALPRLATEKVAGLKDELGKALAMGKETASGKMTTKEEWDTLILGSLDQVLPLQMVEKMQSYLKLLEESHALQRPAVAAEKGAAEPARLPKEQWQGVRSQAYPRMPERLVGKAGYKEVSIEQIKNELQELRRNVGPLSPEDEDKFGDVLTRLDLLRTSGSALRRDLRSIVKRARVVLGLVSQAELNRRIEELEKRKIMFPNIAALERATGGRQAKSSVEVAPKEGKKGKGGKKKGKQEKK